MSAARSTPYGSRSEPIRAAPWIGMLTTRLSAPRLQPNLVDRPRHLKSISNAVSGLTVENGCPTWNNCVMSHVREPESGATLKAGWDTARGVACNDGMERIDVVIVDYLEWVVETLSSIGIPRA